MQDERERARGRVEHEEPDDHARRARESSRDVEEEAKGRADALGQVVEHQREPDDEDRLADQPERHELEDVLERRYEAIVVEGVDEARAEAAGVAEREVDRVDHRRDAEQQQQRDVERDEEVAGRARGAGRRPLTGPAARLPRRALARPPGTAGAEGTLMRCVPTDSLLLLSS